MNRTFTLCLLFSLFIVSNCFSQGNPVALLKGIIVNATTGEAVNYATIRLSKDGINTMSNGEGRFVFKIPTDSKNDSIYISHVGYKPQTITLHALDTTWRMIKLQPEAVQLPAVVVKAITPLELVKKAIAKIPENYSTKPYVLNGFYRMTGRKEQKIFDISEAVFDVYNANYDRKNKQIKLIKSRLDKDLTAFNGSDNIHLGVSPDGILKLDIIGNLSESELLNKQGLKDHQFTSRGTINYNGREAYEILFDQKDGVKKTLFKGKMIIDADNLAFLEFDYVLSPKGLQYWQQPGLGQRMLLKIARMTLQMQADTTVITYVPYGGKYYLNHCSGGTRFYLKSPRFEFNPLYNYLNFLITRIDTVAVAPFEKDKEALVKGHSTLESYSPDNPDSTEDAFWASYNLIQADYNVDSAARIIRSNNSSLNYKQAVQAKLSKMKGSSTARIDSILSFFYEKGQFSGTALVKKDGKVIYEKAFGWANKEKGISNSLQTRFRIGSTSKQFTSMLIMQLVKEHTLTVTDTIGKFLPGYVHGSVTIQQLLTHQSGIPNLTENDDYKASILLQAFPLDTIIRRFCSDPLEFARGTQFHYSNSGYILLAAIVEKLTGKKYADALAEKIFIPAGMSHSFFGAGMSTDTTISIGYVDNAPEVMYPVQNLVGAGGITSTVEDLLQWSDALSAYKLLPREQTEEWFKPRIEWKEWEAAYGYGWMMDRLLFGVSKEHLVQYHPGTELGQYAMFVRQPDKDITIVLLNNTGDFPRFEMTDLILNELN
jgi:CubicO group peptidase (beta-lactamase class C family)